MEKRSAEMEVKNINVRNMKYGDFNDNEYLEQYVEELKKNGVNVLVGKLNDLINWGRSNSVWPLTFATSCCGIEFMCVGGAHTDFARFGWEVYRNSPRQADVIFVFGTIVHKMAPVLKRLYEQLAEPKYVIAVGSCAIGGGPFKNSYHVVKGVNEIIPVDVYVPGCPPRPDAILYGMMQLSRKIKVQDFFKLTVENESVDNNPQSENEDEQD
jgi:NADH-quinone oxidoreductase subunit B